MSTFLGSLLVSTFTPALRDIESGKVALFMDVWVVGGLGGWVWGLRGSASRGR